MYKTKNGLYRKQVTIDGKRVVFNGRTQREVYQRIAQYQEQQKKSGTPFKVVARDWWYSVEGNLSPNTVKGYSVAHDRAVEWFGDDNVEDITKRDVQDYITRFSSQYAQKTISNHLLVLRLILDFAVRHYRLENNPAALVKPPKGKGKKEREFPTEDEIAQVVHNYSYNYKGVPIGLFMLFCLQTGLRRGEVCALRYKDIDRKKNVIHVTQSVYWDDAHKPHLKEPKSKAGIRDVPLLPTLAEKIGTGKASAYIFGGAEPLHEYQIEKALEHYRTDTGITVTPHGLRHGFASVAFTAGLDVKEVQTLLGHAQSSTTMDIYVHVIEKEMVARAGEQIGAFFDERTHDAHTTTENSEK